MPPSESPRPWLRVAVWAVGAVAYLAAIISRTSLSATGALASDRYDLSSDQLALFGILQLLVYAGVQIPVGMLIDRLGARVALIAGLAIVAISQLMIGFGETFAVLLIARGLAGLGDALIFPSAIRLTAVSLRPAWVATGTQLVGVVGNFGVLITAAPLLVLIDVTGWETGYLVMFALSGVIALGAIGILALMGADRTRTASGETLGAVIRGTAEAARYPGTWLAFTVHAIASAPYTAFIVTWGVLFLTHGAGLDEAGAGVFLGVMPVVGAVSGVLLGRLSGDRPRLRGFVLVSAGVAHIVVWSLVLLWPGQPIPWGVLGLLVVVTAAGGPASLVGFELSREFVPARLAARANGIVNMGGFSTALVIIWLTGLMLTLQGATTPDDYTMGMFRIAFLPMLAILAVGVGAYFALSARVRRS